MKIPPRAVGLALLAGMLWMGIGLAQKMGRGMPLGDALVSELPLTALITLVALVIAAQRNQGR